MLKTGEKSSLINCNLLADHILLVSLLAQDKISRHTITQIDNNFQKFILIIGGQRSFHRNEAIYQRMQVHNTENNHSMVAVIKQYKIPSFITMIDIHDFTDLKPKQYQVTQSLITLKEQLRDIDSHTAHYVESHHSIYIFGGYINQSQLSNSLFKLAIEDQEFQEVRVLDNISPAARCDHASAYVSAMNCIFVFGGKAGHLDERLDDFWMFSLDKSKWTQLVNKTQTPLNVPFARSGHGLVYNDKNKLYLFGGRGNDSVIQEVNDLWAYNLKTQQWEIQHSFTNPSESGAFESPTTAVRLTKMIKNLKNDYQSPLRRHSKKHEQQIIVFIELGQSQERKQYNKIVVN
eukprot:403366000